MRCGINNKRSEGRAGNCIRADEGVAEEKAVVGQDMSTTGTAGDNS